MKSFCYAGFEVYGHSFERSEKDVWSGKERLNTFSCLLLSTLRQWFKVVTVELFKEKFMPSAT